MTTFSQRPPEPTDLDALAALALRECHAGRLSEAAAIYHQILAVRPDSAQTHNLLGNVLLIQGKLDEAAAEYQQALAHQPDLFQAHNNLGNIFRKQGKLDEAAARYHQVIALAPHRAEPYNNLGNVLLDQGKLDEAAVQFERALALRPDLAEPHLSLGNVLQRQRKFGRAVAHYEQALALKPDLAEAHYNLGNMLQQQHHFDQAAVHYQRAMALNPNILETHLNLGTIFQAQGKFDQAAAQYEQSLAKNPSQVEPRYNRAILKTFQPDDPELAELEALAAEPNGLTPKEMLYIHFALGKALDDVGDYERAFQHLLKGNALKRSEVKYDEAVVQQDFWLCAELFDSQLLDRFRGVGDPSQLPIFIVGMPRSGSTLVEQILASHPQVHAAGELSNLGRIVKGMTDAKGRPLPFPACIRVLGADDLRQLGQAYLANLPALADGKTRITDKALINFLRIGLIRLILPNARIIHTMRDPAATCFSCFSILFALGQPFSYDLAELGRFYRSYHELMAHWRRVLPAGAMLDVVYEDVVDNLEVQARRLLDYCGLPWDDRCLSFYKTNRSVTTASDIQVRQPLYRDSLAHWRHYEAYLQPLLAELASCRP